MGRRKTEREVNSTAFPLPRYIPQFDGLRALSILGVFCAHSEFLRSLPYASVLVCGRFGVDLFFVLSGFLITGILLDSKNSQHYLRNFYVRRALRIWPLYYCVLTAVFLTWNSWKVNGVVCAPYFYFYAQNLGLPVPTPLALGATWSLALEEQFYLAWPPIVALLKKRGLAIILCGFIATSLLFRIVAYQTGAAMIHHFTFSRLDGIAFGGLAAVWIRSKSCSLELWKRFSWQFLIVGGTATLLFRLVWTHESTTVSYTFIAASCVGLLGLALTQNTRKSLVGRFLTNSTLRYVGRISYGLYLLHLPLFLLVKRLAESEGFNDHSPAAVRLTLALSQFSLALLVASFSWRFLESPILGLKTFFPSGSKMHWPAPDESWEATSTGGNIRSAPSIVQSGSSRIG